MKRAVKGRWKRRAVRSAAALLALGLLAFLVAASGAIPIAASEGHWPVTEWFLHFTMRRSVAMRSLDVTLPPALDERELVLRGAGHYETGCRPCHGSPGFEQPAIPRAMTPHPPYLPPRLAEWEPQELFTIVRHGVKMTGMPAWPALEREDEVWAVVAFLRRLPDLDAAGYRALVEGERGPPEPALLAQLGPAGSAAAAQSCARCHGRDGLGRQGAFPVLAGQRRAYLEASLAAFANGERKSGIMQPLAAALTPEALGELAQHYADLPRSPPGAGEEPPGMAEAAVLEEGERIAREGIPARDVPACVDCHGPSPTPRRPVFPDLAGQPASYLALQLELFAEGHRGGTSWARLMREFAHELGPEERAAVAAYYAGLTATARDAAR